MIYKNMFFQLWMNLIYNYYKYITGITIKFIKRQKFIYLRDSMINFERFKPNIVSIGQLIENINKL